MAERPPGPHRHSRGRGDSFFRRFSKTLNRIDSMKRYNILICGAGAVGGYFGGKLFKAGFDIVFADLPDRVETLRKTGLIVKSGNENAYDYKPKIVSSLDGLPCQDFVLVCVKAYQTYEIALKLLPVLKPSTILLSLQNGIENEEVLSQILGKSLIMGAVPFFNGRLQTDNCIVQNGPAQLIYGEMDHQQSEREEWVSEILSHADIDHTISRSINIEIWKNFIWNNAFNTISALTKTTFGQILAQAEILSTVRQMMHESQQVALAEGHEITNQHIDDIFHIGSRFANLTSTMHMDIDLGQMPEVEALVGVLLKKAKKHGITAQVNQTIYNLLQLTISARDIRPGIE